MSGHSTIRMGSKGADVVAWQKIIGVTPDGDFGPQTRAATIAWQKAHHLDPDGVVGPKTWAAAGQHGASPQPGGGGGGGGGGNESPPPPGGLVYPLWQPALAPFTTGARFFGAPRPGRLHAADDLLAPYLSKIRAIADGEIIQPPYPFYLGTNALEVHHPGVGTVRYGEISSAKVIPWKSGTKVKCGELIAYVGRIDTTGASMIHFELYSGKASGPLTETWNQPYERRRDLINPASLIDRLYKLTFGH